jgi:predicted secreted Zn-dependent protease
MMKNVLSRILWPAVALMAATGSQVNSANLPPALSGFPHTQARYYDVHGRTARAIITDLNARAPRGPDGSHVGYTDWRLESGWREETTERSCRVIDPVIRFSAVVTLPRLVDETSLSPMNQANWRSFAEAVETHEAGHVRIALDHIADVEAAILASRCGGTAARVQIAIDRVKALQVEYDRVTRHGQAQGGVLKLID